MFNLGAPEVLVIMVLALIVLGPQRLPDAAKQVGRAIAEIRKLSTGFQQEMKAAFDQESESKTRATAATAASDPEPEPGPVVEAPEDSMPPAEAPSATEETQPTTDEVAAAKEAAPAKKAAPRTQP